jgi:hypothetical protein
LSKDVIWGVRYILWRNNWDRLGGYGQGNGTSQAAFTILNTLIINAYKRIANGAKLTSSYTARMFLLAAALYVDDTDLLHCAEFSETEDEELVEIAQGATDNFANLAQASGGTLKPSKCFVYFLTYQPMNGKMKLKPLKKLPEPACLIEVKQKDGSVAYKPSHINVLQPDGSRVPIPTMDVSVPTKMLGAYFTPIGNGVPHMEAMKENGLKWVDSLQTRPLPTQDVWLLLSSFSQQ